MFPHDRHIEHKRVRRFGLSRRVVSHVARPFSATSYFGGGGEKARVWRTSCDVAVTADNGELNTGFSFLNASLKTFTYLLLFRGTAFVCRLGRKLLQNYRFVSVRKTCMSIRKPLRPRERLRRQDSINCSHDRRLTLNVPLCTLVHSIFS